MTPSEFANIAAPELNHLLTTPEFDTPTGLDFGWFCREHAFCTYILGALLGNHLPIVRGHIAIMNTPSNGLTTLGTTSDHAWNWRESKEPFDLSATLSFYPNMPQLQSPIIGVGENGRYAVHVETAGYDEHHITNSVNTITYVPRTFIEHSAGTLFVRPRLILNHDHLIPVCRAAILHVYRIASNSGTPLSKDLSQDRARRLVLKHFPDAKKDVNRLLNNSA